MTLERLRALLEAFSKLRIAVVGDFCLDRYLEIDALHEETSIETGLPVYKVDRVRSQPGAAGTVLNNLVGLGVGTVFAVGFCGDDGEGYELERALRLLERVDTRHFLRCPERRTFTYCKPLLLAAGELPRELNRLDSKNWTPTPESLSLEVAHMTRELAGRVDAVAVMDQVDIPGTGVVTPAVLEALEALSGRVPVVADSRSGLEGFPPLIFKLNRSELNVLAGLESTAERAVLSAALEKVAERNMRPAFVTLAEDGILGAFPGLRTQWAPSLALRGPIDIVGAGDSVTAALTAGLAAGATLSEALELAMLAASVTVHQIGTTGVAEAGALLAVARMG
ncbi:MAG: bifunctional sugar kinase/adenylyltransferase [Verrucomicrobia bacterium]|nr:MAG: bifunctional sugar kinase/adenylyltransferase [Verrucomicrobiota bacterium]